MNAGQVSGAIDEEAQVLSVARSGGRAVHALLAAPKIASKAIPMQFVMVKVREGSDPFLRRPFCISRLDAEAGLIGITWDVVGRGTEIMAAWEPGQKVPVLGPLGNGLLPETVAPDSRRRLFIVAGGTGLAPMGPLAESAKARGWEVAVLYGARAEEFLLDTSAFSAIGCPVAIATDDGSVGVHGFVTEIAASALKEAGPGDIAVSCGPAPMIAATKSLCARSGVTLYLSLEQRMACGTGLCRGCAVKMAREDRYYHVCSDGPVFLAEDVDLRGEVS